MTFLIDIGVIALLIFLNGLLAMSEMAIVSSRRSRLLDMADKGQKGAKKALHLVADPSTFLASIQIGITLIGIIAGAFSGATLAKAIGEWLSSIINLSPDVSQGIAFSCIVSLITYLSLIAGELVPKRLAMAHPEAIATSIAGPLSLLTMLMSPAVKLLSISTETALKIFGIKPKQEALVTVDEVKIMIEQGMEDGAFEKTEETIMKRAMQLNDLHASDIMTPRPQVSAIHQHWSFQELIDHVRRTGHSYYPVHDGSVDKPVGIFSTKLFFADPTPHESGFSMTKYMIEPVYMPETMRSSQIIAKFKQTSKHVAIVIDEFGGMAGLVTIADIMEAMIGFLPHHEDEETFCVRREDGTWLADGMIPIRMIADYTLNDRLNFLAHDDDVQTLGGWMMKELGRIPAEGDYVDKHGVRFEVMDMDRHRVDKVLIDDRQAGENEEERL